MISLPVLAAILIFIAGYTVMYVAVVVLTSRQRRAMKARWPVESSGQEPHPRRMVAQRVPIPPWRMTAEREVTGIEREIRDVNAYLRDLETESAALPNDHPEQEALAVLRTAAENRLEDLQRQVDTERVEALGERWMNMKTYPKGDR